MCTNAHENSIWALESGIETGAMFDNKSETINTTSIQT